MRAFGAPGAEGMLGGGWRGGSGEDAPGGAEAGGEGGATAGDGWVVHGGSDKWFTAETRRAQRLGFGGGWAFHPVGDDGVEGIFGGGVDPFAGEIGGGFVDADEGAFAVGAEDEARGVRGELIGGDPRGVDAGGGV